MTPKEKLQKKVADKRIELDRAEVKVEMLGGELRLLEVTMRDLFGDEPGEPKRGGRPTDAVFKEEQERLLKILDEAPAEGFTVRQLGELLFGEFNETIRSRVTQRLQRGIENNVMERVSEGHYRLKRANISVVPNS